MADYAYPKALTGMQDTQWSNFILKIIPDGATTEGAFAPTATGSGMTVSLAAGEGFVQGVLGGDAAPASVTISAAPSVGSGLARIDTIVKRLDRTTTPVIQTVVRAGEPAADPSPPTLTQSASGVWEWPVADVRVDAGVTSIVQAKVTDRRSFTALPVRSWSTRPTAPRKGQLGYNTATGVWEYFNGTSWVDLVPAHDLNGAQHTGTLSIARGGTGATTATAALNALGIFVQPTAPTNVAGRVWIKTSA
jgi:hypothetical protein